MDLNEKELIEQARMMGVPAHEFAAKFITRDLVEASLTAVRKVVKLKENQEGKLIEELNASVKELISAAVAVIAAQGQSVITCTVKSVMVAGKTIRVVSDVDTSDPQRHALTDTVNHRALLVLAPDEYSAALESNKPQKDQSDLPLEPHEAASSVHETDQLTAQLPDAKAEEPVSAYELAFIHVTHGGEISPKAIQNAAGIKRKDVADIILTLAANGIISEPDDDGVRTLIPVEQRQLTVADQKHGSGKLGDPAPANEPAPFDEDQYADAVLLVQRERKVSLSFLKSNFSIDESTAEAMILRMEQDGVVSEPNDIGGRAIYD